jgi:uncharacterized integral membrane protein
MLTKTRSTPVASRAPGVRDPSVGAVSDGAAVGPEASAAPTQASPATTNGGETRTGRFRRKAHRTRLHAYAIATVALVAYLIALAAMNTAQVKVSWVFGTSHVSLVWLVLFAAILGWLLGLVATATFHWRTRTPRQRGGSYLTSPAPVGQAANRDAVNP